MSADRRSSERGSAEADAGRHDDGALDMLLKNHYQPTPPEGYFDQLWPAVEQRLDEDRSSAGSQGDSPADDVLVFKASPAIDALRIPERRPRQPTGSLPTVGASSGPPPQSSGYRWPVAFVAAAAILVGGFLVYQKSVRDSGQQGPTDELSTEPIAAPGVEPAMAADAMALAAATPSGADAALGGGNDEADESSAAGAGEESGETAATEESGSRTESARPDERPERGAGRARRSHQRRRARRARRDRRGKREPSKGAAAKEAGHAPGGKSGRMAKKAKKGKKGKKGDALDSLIDNALGGSAPAPGKPAKAAPARAAADPSLPKQLTMNQIRKAMRAIKPRVTACYDKYQIEGTARVKLSIAPAGKPSSVKVKGKFFGTDTGNCVAKAVRRARFPKFSGKQMSITFPFVLSQ